MSDNTEFLRLTQKLSRIPGVSGDEQLVRDAITEEIKLYVDKLYTDTTGNLIAFKRGEKQPEKRVMVSSHTDEVGFMITYITESGMLKFGIVGGMDKRILPGLRVKVGANGICGVIASKAIHLQSKEDREKAIDAEKLYIDIGAKDREDAQRYVAIGDTVIFDSDYVEFGDGSIKGKALDDRLGCAMMVSIIKKPLKYDTWFAFTTMEEIGAFGSKTAAYSIKPDIAMVLETTTAVDFTGVDEQDKACFLGEGPVVPFMDRGSYYDKGLFELAAQTAISNGIKWQTKKAVAGGTDASSIQRSIEGVRVLGISVPCRNLHSPSCVIKAEDAEGTLRLASAMLEIFGGLTSE